MEPEATVFVVDDEPAVLEAVAEMVRTIGLRVQSYHSAQEFLEAYKPIGPGCLVLNVRMPGKSGLELQNELARTGNTLPVIVITGYANERVEEEAMKAGAVDFLRKPFRMQELCDSIQKAIQSDREKWRAGEP